jgi:hypothetical protein
MMMMNVAIRRTTMMRSRMAAMGRRSDFSVVAFT